jgi:N-acetylmuramoyl-L-alanine amidase
MLEILERIIPESRRNRPLIQLKPEYITIHDTANSAIGADAEAHAKYLFSDAAASRPVSWHYTVDDKRIIHHIPDGEVAWHAGDGRDGPGNRTSIGIEICENADGDREKAEENAAELAAMLMLKYNITFDKLVQHNKWTGKDCPHVLRHKPGGWVKFVGIVSRKYLNMKGGDINKLANPRKILLMPEGGEFQGYTINGKDFVEVREIMERLGYSVVWKPMETQIWRIGKIW